MIKNLFLLFVYISSLKSGAQIIIQPGANVRTTADVLITFDNINVTNNDPASEFSSAVFNFKGSNNTLLGGSGNWSIKKIIIDKVSAQLGLLSAVQVNQQIQLVNGNIDLNNQIMTLFAGATLEGENETNRVIGPSGGTIQTTVSLNVPSNQNPGRLGAIISSNQNLGVVTVKRWHNTQSGEAKIQRFYEIIPANNSGLNATLRLTYLDAELFNNPEPTLAIYTKTNSSNTWNNIGGDAKDLSQNFIEKTGLSSLQQYSIGTSDVILPLKWGPITATCLNNNIQLQWTTLQETNVHHFLVQRASTTGWITIKMLNATGNSSTAQTYTFIDATAMGTLNQYRIVSVDADDKQEISKIISVKSCSDEIILKLSPVPATTETVLTIAGSQNSTGEVYVSLLASDGKLVFRKVIILNNSGAVMPISINGLANGTYFVKVQFADGFVKALPLIKK